MRPDASVPLLMQHFAIRTCRDSGGTKTFLLLSQLPGGSPDLFSPLPFFQVIKLCSQKACQAAGNFNTTKG